MGLLETIFGKPQPPRKVIEANEYFKLLTGYSPVFSTWNGELFESELVRAAIEARSRNISKLQVEVSGTAQQTLQKRLKRGPNTWQSWSQWLARLNTILDMQNTAFIVPVYDRFFERTGFATILPQTWELVQVDGDPEPWIRFRFADGSAGADKLSHVGIMVKHQYRSDFFGEGNEALNNTMALLDIQSKGIEEAIKASSTIKFWCRVKNFSRADDLAKERKRFTSENLEGDSGGPVLLFPNTYDEIHQADVKPYTVDYNTQQLIQNNVKNYFGVSDKIMQNTASSDEMDAFYSGAIQPFAIQLSEVLTRLIFTDNEVAYGNHVIVKASRLTYMTTTEKISVIGSAIDRGLMMIDEARELMDLEPLPDGLGKRIPIRGEFHFLGEDTGNTTTEGGSENAIQ